MIKIIRDLKSKSYWKGNDLFNTERDKSLRIKIFGLTLWNSHENFKDEVVDHKSNEVGYKKKPE